MTTVVHPTRALTSRLRSIDALRGLIILFMLLDHVRETFFLHRQVLDPMDITATGPEVFFSRLLAHLCAPLFVLLTGLSAYLYGEKYSGRADVSAFLLKRGLFLIALEFTLVSFAWTFQFPPTVIYLQVIWAIGLSMVALSAMVYLPRWALVVIGVMIIAGHNLLDSLHFGVESAMHIPWAILHDRGWIEVSDSLRLRTSYPLLPWIGIIALGYAAGPWFSAGFDAASRRARLWMCGLGALLCFMVLRLINGYGEKPWSVGETELHTVMSFLNITKYPPSLLFISLTLGIGMLILIAFERCQEKGWLRPLVVLGSAPMFFYLLHLYVLKILYLIALAIWGKNQGNYFGFEHMWGVWLTSVVLAVLLFPAVRWFASLKARRRDISWLKYL
ncbi:hypothetical protein BZK31_17325 [Pseudomonas floridensis]|uniref:Heparan-alpha-glucosaminide N-acetyltransferase catalytic domain-containing protein n=1 Tax=Pseudomonas floridensis TaxID=1958950 RepID=A0A1X0N334_9PSED|nr:DUF1624 domain-containing protein [Pseudomonas floridensis]ORC57914.1 hypothetical protein BZK31_17325 [Pseudomonas floridensis]